jgi:putative serine protease PepD
MPLEGAPPVVSQVVEFDDGEEEGREDDRPLFAWLPPEDRLWRHPSEVDDGSARPDPPPPPVGPSAPNLLRPVVRVWSMALFAGLAGALLASGFFMATGFNERHTTVVEPIVTPSTVAIYSTPNNSSGSATVGDWPVIAGNLTASLVGVRVSNEGNLQVGSGVLYGASDTESYIITAQDLVSGNRTVTVTFSNGDIQAARVVGTDPVTGVAVLATAGSRRSFPTFGSVSNVQVAEEVLALGTRVANPKAVVTDTVSGLDQSVSTASDSNPSMAGMIALSGGAVPESTNGGALIDPNGSVVGIDTDITSSDLSAQGVAYAVPIDVAEHVAQQLLKGNRPTHPWLGVEDATDLTSASAHQLGVPGGAQVGAVDPDSPAALVGLRANDVVTGFDGQAVDSSGALVALLAQCQPGSHASLSFFRQSQRWRATVTIAEQPQTAAAG